jgi:hypothetical protein
VKLALSLLIALAACGDNNKGPTDGAGVGSDSGVGPNANLTTYVTDLVLNHTTATDVSKPYTDFSTLPDPDGDSNNGSAYSALFQ